MLTMPVEIPMIFIMESDSSLNGTSEEAKKISRDASIDGPPRSRLPCYGISKLTSVGCHYTPT